MNDSNPTSATSSGSPSESPSRRSFMQTTTAAVVGGAALQATRPTQAQPAGFHQGVDETIRVGLIGCGGRGMGAAVNATNADKNAKLTVMCDLFKDRLDFARGQMSKRLGDQYDVDDSQAFTDFDGFKQVMDSDVDVVLLCTTPYFRPEHLEAAVDAGKHVFCEKPVAVDAPGVRRVWDTCRKAANLPQPLNIVSGLCWRYDLGVQATMDKILNEGAIGDIVAIQENYLTGTLWHRGNKDSWTDMEYQMRNWLYFTWLSGDHIAEQHIHSLDKALWLNGDVPPARAFGLGGRQVRTQERFGHVYDHFAVCYEWDSGVKTFAYTRQMSGCHNDVDDYVLGSKGKAEILRHTVQGEGGPWKYNGPKPSMYDVEHQELFKAIREGRAINNGDYMCYSTLMAILGREACYTGEMISWDDMWNSNVVLGPEKVEWGDVPTPPVAMPGKEYSHPLRRVQNPVS